MRFPRPWSAQTSAASEARRGWAWRLFPMVAVALFGFWFWNTVHSPASPVLLPGSGGEWIRESAPLRLTARFDPPRQVIFRHTALVPPGGGTLEVGARDGLKVFVDRLPIAFDPKGPPARRGDRIIQVPPRVSPGFHEFEFLVEATRTHPLLRVHAPALGLITDASWETSRDSHDWRPAALARAVTPPTLAGEFPSTLQALSAAGPWLLLAFGAGAAGTILMARRTAPRAAQVRVAILGLWAALAVNNLIRLPYHIGMDAAGHLDYVKYLVEHHRLPLAVDGWQMFQPPLAYLLSAPLYALAPAMNDAQALVMLRALPLLCGLLQVEVCFRAVRAVFPHRGDLQIAGTLIGGFLPINVFISQAFGNEPLAGLLGSLALLLVLARHQARRPLLDPGFGAALGALLGLTLLAKVSVLLVIPFILAFCVFGEDAGTGRRLRFLAATGGALALVAGWYFLRNWVHMGRPFIGGWDPARGFAYWQDPGYITFHSLTTFGTALVRPIYAGAAGFWDGLYSTLWLDGTVGSIVQRTMCPPWNYPFVVASALTALAPCAALAAGAAALWRKPAGALCLACLAALVLGIFRLYVTEVPSYATLKGSYLMGLLPCFAILGAAGMDRLAGKLWTRAVGNGLLAAWVVSVYAGYFIVR